MVHLRKFSPSDLYRIYEIVVELRPESTGGACVQCIGEVVGEVTVSNLAEGTYTLKLETPQGKRTTTVSID